MLKYNKITKSVWNKIKKIIEKELDLKIDNNDSGKFTVKYVSIKYEYNGKDKTLIIATGIMREWKLIWLSLKIWSIKNEHVIRGETMGSIPYTVKFVSGFDSVNKNEIQSEIILDEEMVSANYSCLRPSSSHSIFTPKIKVIKKSHKES